MSDGGGSILIRRADPVADADRLLDLWFALYGDHAESRAIESAEMRRWFERDDAATFVAVDPVNPATLLGYIDVGGRSIVDSCASSPVAYIEAWYVVPDRRKQGIGEWLMRAAEKWSRETGYEEMGSDTELDNTLSQRLHGKFGFEETGRVVNFRKSL